MQFKTDVKNLKNKKFFKVKKAKRDFLCALCKAPRQMRYSKNLTEKNYIQILLLSATITWLTFPYLGVKSLAFVLVIWPIFEFTNKSLYRKEIPCPYCGFDATWYRRDVKVARSKVEDFWTEKLPETKKESFNIPNAAKQNTNIAEIQDVENQAQ